METNIGKASKKVVGIKEATKALKKGNPQTLNLFYLPMFDSNSYKKELLP